ncbi:MAG: group III truncated hemoglobin [Nitrococcus mobilis]|nr:group III truncated hemoglobin [Nitrococcus mobilis]
MDNSVMNPRTHQPIDHETVCRVVDDFYGRVQSHPTLAEPFKRVKDWPEHIARLSHFWWITMGGERYRNDQYHVIAKHMPIGVTDALVDDWLALFHTTLEDHLTPEQTEFWYGYAEQLGQSIRMLAQMRVGGQATPPR